MGAVPATLLGVVLVLVFWARARWERSGRVVGRSVLQAVLVLWCLALLAVTLSPEPALPGVGPAVEPVPFQQIRPMLANAVWWQVPLAQLGGNVALWVPGAAAVALLRGWRPLRCAAGAAVAAVLVEVLQLVLVTGRVASTDDVLLAALGGLLGGLVAVGGRTLVRAASSGADGARPRVGRARPTRVPPGPRRPG